MRLASSSWQIVHTNCSWWKLDYNLPSPAGYSASVPDTQVWLWLVCYGGKIPKTPLKERSGASGANCYKFYQKVHTKLGELQQQKILNEKQQLNVLRAKLKTAKRWELVKRPFETNNNTVLRTTNYGLLTCAWLHTCKIVPHCTGEWHLLPATNFLQPTFFDFPKKRIHPWEPLNPTPASFFLSKRNCYKVPNLFSFVLCSFLWLLRNPPSDSKIKFNFCGFHRA